MNYFYGISKFHAIFIHESVEILSSRISVLFISFAFHNKGDKNGPFAQLLPPHKNVQIESSGWT